MDSFRPTPAGRVSITRCRFQAQQRSFKGEFSGQSTLVLQRRGVPLIRWNASLATIDLAVPCCSDRIHGIEL